MSFKHSEIPLPVCCLNRLHQDASSNVQSLQKICFSAFLHSTRCRAKDQFENSSTNSAKGTPGRPACFSGKMAPETTLEEA